jgi:LmbE family N-acetylglucosaminyl deacetylase
MESKSLVVLTLLISTLLSESAQARKPNNIASVLSRETRLMVFAPHPDDESLGTGGLIQRALALGGTLKVVFMTNGDGYPEGVELMDHISHPSAKDYRDYGDERRLEAIKAVTALGAGERDAIFLGFPDGGLYYLLKSFRSDSHVYRSPFTLASRPPLSEKIVPKTDYNGHDLLKEIRRVLTDFQPNLLILPASNDQHPDHWATYHFVRQALVELERKHQRWKPVILTYLVHFGQWPIGQGSGAGLILRPPRGFLGRKGDWLSFSLNPGEVEIKRKAILQHQTQVLVMGRFLLSFARGNELFIALP